MKQFALVCVRLFHHLQNTCTPITSTALWYPHAEGPLLVTGASGPLAQMVLSDLLNTYRVPPREIVCVTRSVNKLKWLKQRRVEVRFGDFDFPKSLPAAFSGGDIQYSCNKSKLTVQRIIEYKIHLMLVKSNYECAI